MMKLYQDQPPYLNLFLGISDNPFWLKARIQKAWCRLFAQIRAGACINKHSDHCVL